MSVRFGIDFGTSFTTLSAYDEQQDRVVVIKEKNGNEKIPSVIYYMQSDKFEFGTAAKKYAEGKGGDSARAVFGIKRQFDKNATIIFPDGNGEKEFSVLELVSKFFIFLKENAEEMYFSPAHLEITDVCITHPVDFSAEQKDLLLQAARNAGFIRVEILEEPVAAALAFLKQYSQSEKMGKNIVVYDLGGGTFDLAFVHLHTNREWRVSALGGDKNCGGRDFDLAVYQHLQNKIREAKKEPDFLFAANKMQINNAIYRECVDAKEGLSQIDNYCQDSFSLYKATQGEYDSIEISRQEFENLIGNRIQHTVTLTEKLLEDVKKQGYIADTLVLIGGSSIIPMIEQRLSAKINLPIFRAQDADTAVAQGAVLKPQKITRPPVKVTEEEVAPVIKRATVTTPQWAPSEYKGAAGICKHCKAPLFKEQVFCFYCGKLVSSISGINDTSIISALESRLQKVIHFASEYEINPIYQWNETASKYATQIEQLKKVLHNCDDDLKKSIPDHLFEHLDIMLDKCKNADFHIALIGTIKAGKSTLLNALLRGEYASTSVTPETAVLTKFRSSEKSNFVKLTYYTTAEWTEIWSEVEKAKKSSPDKIRPFLEEYQKLNAESVKSEYLDKQQQKLQYESIDGLQKDIHEWTSSQSPIHYFVKEVEVSLENLPLPSQIVFVDTPGLDDILEYRSNITKKYIRRANAVLVCVFSGWMPGQSLDTIFQVFDNVGDKLEKVYVIGTQIDKQNFPIEDWAKQKEKWIDYLKGSLAFQSETLARKNIIGTAAYRILDLLKMDINSTVKADLRYFAQRWLSFDESTMNDNDLRNKFEEFCNIDFLKNKIQNELIDKFSELLVDDIICNYELCIKETIEMFEAVRKSSDDLIKSMKLSIADLSKQQEEHQQMLQEIQAQQTDVGKIKLAFRQQIKVALGALKAEQM